MKLNKFYIRYYPPGIVFEYQKQRKIKQKILDLFDIEQETNVEKLAAQIASDEPLITPKILPQLETILQKLKDKTLFNNWENVHEYFNVDKTLSSGHLLPITNVSIDKFGDICATGSYDRTCKIWNTRTGEETSTLIGHENAVYVVSLAIAGRLVSHEYASGEHRYPPWDDMPK
ncbi:unnamed protein product [Macrosiphum euphorbiae]|uniref:Uncharacterized protein n=1 Tax=Macrosiphum euphorbiae TaxID=13131 RepID=A0AAV0WZ01_9HEMI|nr:unnamed protein product [Macrosiphum euphorbiae]